MITVIIVGAGVVPVLSLFLSGSRTVEKGGAILEVTIAAQNILDSARSDAFLWEHIPLKIDIPSDRFPQFSLPEFFAKKYKASGTLEIDVAPNHTVLGTAEPEENLIQIAVTINWIENQFPRTSTLATYRANTNSFDLKTSTRF